MLTKITSHTAWTYLYTLTLFIATLGKYRYFQDPVNEFNGQKLTKNFPATYLLYVLLFFIRKQMCQLSFSCMTTVNKLAQLLPSLDVHKEAFYFMLEMRDREKQEHCCLPSRLNRYILQAVGSATPNLRRPRLFPVGCRFRVPVYKWPSEPRRSPSLNKVRKP